MNKRNSLVIKDEMNVLIHRNMELIKLAKTENRELNEEEEKEFQENQDKVKQDEEELKSLDEDLKNENPSPEDGEDKENKNTRNLTMNKSIVKEIRSAVENGTMKFTLNSENRDAVAAVAGFTTGEGENAVQHNTTVVETETKPILEPLYSASLINRIGCTIYSGLPMGDIAVPIMTKNTVGWLGELATAAKTANEFSTVTLQPKRLSAQIEISKMLVAQDTVGVEAAIRRDIVNALQDKFEKTIFGAEAGDTTKPAGLFYGATETTLSTYATLCDFEADLDDKGISGDMKYVMSPKVKAFLRQLAKSSKHTELVYENNEVDGTPAISTALVPTKKLAYGSFQDFIVAFWDNVEVVVDPYTTAANGTYRLIINMYCDAKLARTDAIAFGNIA